ncbi:hypothetical protein [Kineococcus sp. NPDC059986]|uniref:hypothetical protein n=1 Tax=Actinomycetes TaxID=1760 RepID=UPI00344F8E6E
MSNEAKARELGISYGEFLRGHGIRVAYTNSTKGWDYTKQKRWDRTNENYRNAVKAGLEPANVTDAAINRAYEEAS